MRAVTLLTELNVTFSHLLTSEDEEKVNLHLSIFRKLLLSLNQLTDEELKLALQEEQKLFIELFQFKRIAQDEIWNEAPRILKFVLQALTLESTYRATFRSEVEKLGIGVLLQYD